jgi:Leucine-rich repeat (LRR) protein
MDLDPNVVAELHGTNGNQSFDMEGRGTSADVIQGQLALNRLAITAVYYMRLYENRMTYVPPLICTATALTHLWIDHNDLEILPSSLTRLVNLKCFDISFNRLRTLPARLDRLTNLVSLYPRNNFLPSRFMHSSTSYDGTQILLGQIRDCWLVGEENCTKAAAIWLGLRKFRRGTVAVLVKDVANLIAKEILASKCDPIWRGSADDQDEAVSSSVSSSEDAGSL